MEVLRMILPERGSERTGIVAIDDLRAPAAWEQARKDRELWGRSRSEVHALDVDHIAIEFTPGDTLEDTA
jgi:hypothetical protein